MVNRQVKRKKHSVNKRKKPVYLSLIIPVYNEYARLIPGISKVLSYLKRQKYLWELIIVDDGSDVPVSALLTQAKTRNILRYDITNLPVRVIRLSKNTGKGAAIRAGMLAARGIYTIYTDVDLSVPVETIKELLRALQNYSVVIGSRRLTDSAIVVHQAYLREFSGRIFTALSNIVCDARVADATCGFKGYQRVFARKLFRTMKVARWVYDTELLFLIRKWGIDVYELPVAWSNKEGSKVRGVDTVGSLVDLFRIRIYDLLGKYT